MSGPAEATGVQRMGGCLLGLLLSIPLHVVALSLGMALMVLSGLAPMAPWPQRTADGFMISFGFWQWLYLLPAIRYFRTRRPTLASGLAVSGVLGLFMAGLALLSLLHGS